MIDTKTLDDWSEVELRYNEKFKEIAYRILMLERIIREYNLIKEMPSVFKLVMKGGFLDSELVDTNEEKTNQIKRFNKLIKNSGINGNFKNFIESKVIEELRQLRRERNTLQLERARDILYINTMNKTKIGK